MLRLTVLGSGDAFNAGGALHSAYQLEHEGGTLLLECGPSILAGLKREGISTDAPDGVLISHLHGDHFAGLPFLFLEYLFENPRSRPLTIAGPPTTKDRFREVYAAMYQESVFHEVGFEVTHIDANPAERFQIAGFEVRPFLVPHTAKPFSLDYRIESPEGVLVFSGDSAWTDDFITQTQGADLLAVAVDTPYRLHNPEATYAQSCDWTPEEAVGFIKLLGQSTTLAMRSRRDLA